MIKDDEIPYIHQVPMPLYKLITIATAKRTAINVDRIPKNIDNTLIISINIVKMAIFVNGFQKSIFE